MLTAEWAGGEADRESDECTHTQSGAHCEPRKPADRRVRLSKAESLAQQRRELAQVCAAIHYSLFPFMDMAVKLGKSK